MSYSHNSKLNATVTNGKEPCHDGFTCSAVYYVIVMSYTMGEVGDDKAYGYQSSRGKGRR